MARLLVALPGLGSDASSFPVALFDAFRRAGIPVLAVSYPQHCVDDARTLASYAWDEVARFKPASVILLGFSMGGFVAQMMAIRAAIRVEALILIASAIVSNVIVSEQAVAKASAAALTFMYDMSRTRASLPAGAHAADVSEARACQLVLVSRLLLGQNSERIVHQLQRIRCPVLWFHGDADDVLPPRNVVHARRVFGDAMDLRLIRGATHETVMERAVDISSEALDWLWKRVCG